jgi:hypothetical protein
MNMRLIRLISTCAIGLLTITAARPMSRAGTSDDLLARTRAAYAALKTYADTGSIENEFGSAGAMVRERHTFQTAFRAPRQFLFDFVKAQRTDRFVVWSDENAFHTWWQATGVAQDYPRGSGTTAAEAAWTRGASSPRSLPGSTAPR